MWKQITKFSVAKILFALTLAAFITSGISALIELRSHSTSSFLYWLESDPSFLDWLGGWLQNFGTEMLGAVLTFFVFDLVIGKREREHDQTQRRLESQLQAKTRLAQAQTADQKQAIIAEMHKLDLLRAADMRGAELEGIYMANMNLIGTDFTAANLAGADLSDATLENAILVGTNLTGTDMQNVNLQGANLSFAVIDRTIMKGANLKNTMLKSINLANAILDQDTLLQDGVKYQEGMDLTNYTD